MKSDHQQNKGHLVLLGFLIITMTLIMGVSLGWAANDGCIAETDLQANILHVPCLEYAGNEYWVDFDITSWSPVQLQLQTAGAKVDTCLDDDTAQGIYRGCNYFPLDTGNMWSFNNYSWTVSGATHTFNGGTGKRINIGGPCDNDDTFNAIENNGIRIFGMYNRDDSMFEEPPVPEFIFFPGEMKIGDAWGFTFPEVFKLTFNFIGIESVTVPAGTFTNSLKLMIDAIDTENSASYTTYLWLVKNVGIVKAHRTAESPQGYEGCVMVTSDEPLIELREAWINGVSYP